MNIPLMASKMAEIANLPKAEKYDLCYRDYDDMVELIGYIPDPTYQMEDFRGREMLFPKRWVTLLVLPADTEINLGE